MVDMSINESKASPYSKKVNSPFQKFASYE